MSKGKVELPFHPKVLSNLKEAILYVHEKGSIIEGNSPAFSLLGITETSSISIYDYLDFKSLKETGNSHLLVEPANKPNTLIEVRCIQVNRTLYCLLMNDITIKGKSEEVKTYINCLIDPSVEGMVMYDGEKIIDCDETFAHIFGFSLQEINTMKYTELLDRDSAHKLINEIQQYPGKPYQLTGRRKDGLPVYLEVIEHPYNNKGNIIRVSIVRDITKQVENAKMIEYMAYFDDLTDLPNRNFFIKMLDDAIVNARKNEELLAVYYLDLDYLKEINETLGYAFGDKLLKECGTKLKTFLQTDTFIARMSGDEFLILKYGIPAKANAVELAESLITAFEKPVQIDDYEIYTSISIGISVFPDNGLKTRDLIKQANSAMYVIKEKHRNNYKLFESSISENFKSMLTMESELRKALSKDQFEVHYQPQKNLKTGKIIGMEALLRWNHPEKGYIPPLDFISLAEKTGLIIEIGDWVIKEACIQNKTWQDNGYTPAVVSVNLSAKQFHQKSLVEKITSILEETGLAPEYLELELTESMAMTNEDYILATMQRLRQLGVWVSIDDFGTGYSSLKYLSLFPVTKLKIDKMFMDGTQKQNRAIVKSIIHMSHSLNMKVIAEGVETIEQLTFLEEEKCDEMQGFFLSKPLPPEQFSKLFATSN
ncbi:bifunctional diguanylate cyclase/phosphodiesterase [Virgibacillus sp. C22-A2]|uniref:Bifunctional diguanylate cyclase/phosphodiesterase n=1 Tax=Virgibacillus tibetensis TaxID=3042313 RepID=A0ABU6KLM4_9BACI|nr:bifunctional diguanylate cyclase/phosphodiesterase [Virgibacillus sp. C22-A2]